jgi:peroxiredoxin Q/BCP
MAVTIDQPVDDFQIPATNEQTVSLAALKGKRVMIYFYPKDSTPSCTTEGQSCREHYAEFQTANTKTFGVSRDSLKSHENFKAN